MNSSLWHVAWTNRKRQHTSLGLAFNAPTQQGEWGLRGACLRHKLHCSCRLKQSVAVKLYAHGKPGLHDTVTHRLTIVPKHILGLLGQASMKHDRHTHPNFIVPAKPKAH